MCLFSFSGLLLMYNVIKRLKRNDGQIHWGKFYLHRYLRYFIAFVFTWNVVDLNEIILHLTYFSRLTPVLMFVILFIVQLEPFVDKGPLWQRHLDLQNCDDNWWTNLLYINNFYPTNVAADSVGLVFILVLKNLPRITTVAFLLVRAVVRCENGLPYHTCTYFQCLPWTWYIAADMQMFLLSPFVIYLFYRWVHKAYCIIFYSIELSLLVKTSTSPKFFCRYGYRGVIGTSVILGSASIICIAILTKHYDLHPLASSAYKTVSV
jgi:hypothetical protein